MSSSSQAFELYDEEFSSLKRQVQGGLQTAGGNEGGYSDEPDEENGLSHAGDLLGQCDELLQQMALEARSVSESSLKRELLARVRACKAELQALKDDHNKKSLMQGSQRSASASSHRERLLKQQDMLQNQNSQLENARKVLEETEQVALEIGSELSHNRETLETSQGRIRSVAGLTGRARRVLSSMSQRQNQQKFILYGLAAGVVVFFFVMWWWTK